MTETTNIHGTDEGNLTRVLPLRRQILTLTKVYEQADPYYRAALRPIIKTVIMEQATSG